MRESSILKTVALIPVRAGSKGIPGKNIKWLAGRPLLHYALEAALNARQIAEVWVSSDSQEVLAVARQLDHPKLQTLLRPPELATDTASTESVMLHFAQAHAFERLVLIQATSPLIAAGDLDSALEEMTRAQADSVVSMTREHRFHWRPGPGGFVVATNYRPEARPRRQEWDGELFENGAFYVSSRELLLATGCRVHGNVLPFVMKSKTAVELDTLADWELLEGLLRRTGALQERPFPNIELIVSDVDGVLTDGGMYYGSTGESFKKFNTKDGMGIRLWRESGGRFAVITGEDSKAVAERMLKLQVTDYHPGVDDKRAVVRGLSEKYGVPLERIAFIGDDVNDLLAMKTVGLAACPRDAHPQILGAVDYVCRATGGAGCVRELVDLLIRGATTNSAATAAP